MGKFLSSLIANDKREARLETVLAYWEARFARDGP
jgi:hypothetical protein